MSHPDDSSPPPRNDSGRPRRGQYRFVIAGILVALLSALVGPTGPALAKPSRPEIAIPNRLASPAPAGAVGHRACCSHPDPPHTPGVPYRWCVRHHKCWGAHQFVARHVKRFAHWRRDGVTHRILPTRFERKVRRVFAHRGCGARCARTVEHAGSVAEAPRGRRSSRRWRLRGLGRRRRLCRARLRLLLPDQPATRALPRREDVPLVQRHRRRRRPAWRLRHPRRSHQGVLLGCGVLLDGVLEVRAA